MQITETINLPAREEFTGILGATSLTAGVAAVFEENHKNVAVFALEKQYDEPDGDDNLMTLFWRINRLTGRVNLRQTRAELKLDSTDIKLGAPTTYISHIQVGSAGEDLGTADLLALNPEIKGWGQLRREHRDNDWSLAARFHAHAFFIANADGTTTPLLPPAAWAREGDGTKIPADKIPVSVSAPSGIILPRVINVPHFTAQTADIDLGFKLDGANGVRSQYDRLVVPYEYKKGRDQRELGGASHRFTRDFKSIPLDALPGESTLQATDARWDRYVELDFYPDTLQRVALHIWQENQRVAPVAGQPPVDPISNLHINLVYWNDSDGRNYLAPLPGRITHFSALSIAEFHDSGRRQVYLMPRSAKGEPGDTGATGAKGDKGDDGAQGIRGEQGEPGADGAPGATGAKGDKGDDGAQGIRGEQGEPGADGAPGAAGAKGDKGDQGDQGEQGERGLPGADGAAGATGAKGDKGDQGEQGERGLPGADGAAGATGAKGDKGDQGEQGERGLPGADSAVQAVHTLTTANGGIITQTIPTRSRLVLPANYANFKSLEVVVLDNNGQITTRDILVSWLVATASNNRIRVSGAGFMTWTRSSRNMSITEGDEFLAAVLTGAAVVSNITDSTARAAAADAQSTANTANNNSVVNGQVSGTELQLGRPNGSLLRISGLPGGTDQTARDAAAAAQTDATQALTNAGQANDKATQAKATADSATTAAAAAQSTAEAATTPDEAKALIKPFARTGDSTKIAAADIADGLTIPAGGTTKQALVKTSASDRAVEWATISGFNISENLLDSPITTSNDHDSTRTIDLTGAKKVVVGFDNGNSGNRTEFYEFPFTELLSAPLTHSVFYSGGGSTMNFSFPNKTATAAAQIRADNRISQTRRIFYVGKITA